jgi:hypothetical protein
VPIEVEVVNDPGLLDFLIAFGTVCAAAAAAGAAWVANRQNKRLTTRRLHFQLGSIDVLGPSHATMTLVVTNDSFRPITLKDVGFKYAGSSRTEIIVSSANARGPALPVTLQDGAAAEWEFNANDLIQHLGQSRAILQMGALDSRGVEHTQWVSREPIKRIPMRLRRWHRQRRQVRAFRKQIAQMNKERRTANQSGRSHS